MNDIVERIRQMVRDRLEGFHDPGICAELTGAADEIERLRTSAQGARTPALWICFADNGNIRAWTRDHNRKELFRLDGLDMQPFYAVESQAKATKGKAGMAVGQAHVRGSTAGTGLRVGAADAVQPATSEIMDVTAGETAPISLDRQPQYVIEGIILRRLHEKRIEGYTIETAKEIAEALATVSEGSRGTVDLDADMAEHRFYRDTLIEECAQIAEHPDRQMEWPALEQDGQRMSPTARMQQAIAAAIRATALSSTERCGQ